MKKLPFKSLSLYVLIAALIFAGCKDDDPPATQDPTITDIVVNDPNFSILEAAVLRAGLAGALSGGSLTVFAPDNAAFQAAGITEAAIATIPVSTLDSILKYHVIGSPVASGSVPVSDTVKTLLGTNIYASRNGNGVFVNGIKVKTADVAARNGVIHVIESVLTPPTQTIAQIAAGNPAFSTLVSAVQRAGLLAAISGSGKYTVFAPTNDAFVAAGLTDLAAIPDATVEAVVKYHVLTTSVFASDLVNNATPATLQGGNLLVTLPPPAVKVSGSANPASGITTANIVATNGVIHVINRTIVP